MKTLVQLRDDLMGWRSKFAGGQRLTTEDIDTLIADVDAMIPPPAPPTPPKAPEKPTVAGASGGASGASSGPSFSTERTR